MLIVVTAGGVKEKIDNVRSITNSSSGKLGLKIANSFLDNYKNCNLIYIHGKDAEPCSNSNGFVKNIKITSTDDLLNAVTDVLTNNKVDIFVHSMAVADYTTSYVFDIDKLKAIAKNVYVNNIENLIDECTIPTDGKISSDLENPAIVLKKTPKIIHKIKELSPHTFLVGFKLLDNASDEELFEVGFNLLRKNRCNLVLANNISDIRNGNHRGMLIYPEKTFDIVDGKDAIAELVQEKSVERSQVRHPKSIQRSDNNNISTELFADFYNMGKWLDRESFLPKVINHDRTDAIGTYGNLSCKKDNTIFMTCRNVNKANLKDSDISRIETVNLVDGASVFSNVFYHSALKPSIDATIHACIYEHSIFSHIVHIHTDKIFLGYPLISKAYPCGCDKECESIVEIVKHDPGVEVIQLKKHGLIILGDSFEACQAIITDLFNNVPYIDYSSHKISDECLEHIKDVKPEFYNEKITYPLRLNGEDIGCVLETFKELEVHFGIYTMENIRGKRLNIVKKYLNFYEYPHCYILHTAEDCQIAEFYKTKYGFEDYDISNPNDLQYILYKY